MKKTRSRKSRDTVSLNKKVGEFFTSFSVSDRSLTPLKPIFTTSEAIISANTKPYAKRREPMNQGPIGGVD
jgi:hypothetical protein